MPNTTVAQAMEIAIAHHKAGQLPEAESICRQILAALPAYSDALHLLGVIVNQRGDFVRSVELLQQAIAITPNNADYHSNLGLILQTQGKVDQAIAFYERAIVLNPTNHIIHYNLGSAWEYKGDADKAIACYERALAINPNYLVALNNLGNAWRGKSELDRAAGCYQRALAIKPDYTSALNNMGHVWKDRGRMDDAIGCYQRALTINPDYIVAHNNFVSGMLYHPDTDMPGLYARMQAWNRRYVQPLNRFIEPHANNRDPDRRLRIGYVSPDFRKHPVAWFIQPLLAGHDRNAFEVYCYANVRAPDAMTAQLRAHADAWRDIASLSDEQTAHLIRQDRIDILVDLAMHTADNRLLVFARKPAPVQVTYLANAGGTAVQTIDYRFTDRYLDPNEADDIYYLEKSIRLTGTYWCYQSKSTTPPVHELPVKRNGRITLGCLNNFCKINPKVLTTWAELLRQLSSARLIIHSLEGSHRQELIDFMHANGVAADRLELVGKLSLEEYFQAYHRMDIALDPFPYAGGTTTCEALWMGVPVVTLAGRTAVGRAGVSILSNAGLPELIANTPEQYIQIVQDLAGDPSRLIHLRATLRDRMQTSPLMDRDGYIRSVETAYRTLWRIYVESV